MLNLGVVGAVLLPKICNTRRELSTFHQPHFLWLVKSSHDLNDCPHKRQTSGKCWKTKWQINSWLSSPFIWIFFEQQIGHFISRSKWFFCSCANRQLRQQNNFLHCRQRFCKFLKWFIPYYLYIFFYFWYNWLKLISFFFCKSYEIIFDTWWN